MAVFYVKFFMSKMLLFIRSCFPSKPVLHILVPRDILENKKKFGGQINTAYYISPSEIFQAHYCTKVSEITYNKETCVPLTNPVFPTLTKGTSPFYFLCNNCQWKWSKEHPMENGLLDY